MSAQFELNQNLSFLTPGLTFRGILNTNRYSFFDVSRQYSPFYYNMVDYDKLSGLYALNLINNQPGEATEYLDYTPGGKEINTFLYMQVVLNYSRDIGRRNISGSLVGTRQHTLTAGATSLKEYLPYRHIDRKRVMKGSGVSVRL